MTRTRLFLIALMLSVPQLVGCAVDDRGEREGDGMELAAEPEAGELEEAAEPQAQCFDGDEQTCNIVISEHNGVRYCIEGVRYCDAGMWSSCETVSDDYEEQEMEEVGGDDYEMHSTELN